MFKRKKNKPAADVPPEKLLAVYKTAKAKPIATVVLNGYNIESKSALGRHGAMCSFKIIEGDLWQEWNEQEHLVLRTTAGKEAAVKVTALPAEADSYGLIEFL